MRISPLSPHREVYVICGSLLMSCVITVVALIVGVSSLSIPFLFAAIATVITINFLGVFLVLRLFYLLHTQRDVVEIHELPARRGVRMLAYCRLCQSRVCAFCGKCHSVDCADPAPVCEDAAPLPVVSDANRETLRGLWTFPLFSTDDDD